LSGNINALHLLEKYPERIDWDWLSSNRNALHLLERNPEKADWMCLSWEPRAIDLLEKNQERIHWQWISSNPSIFKKRVNHMYLYQRMNIIREELMMKCMHPSRLERYLGMGGDIDDF
jgi:hypothetical protein